MNFHSMPYYKPTFRDNKVVETVAEEVAVVVVAVVEAAAAAVVVVVVVLAVELGLVM